MRNIKAIIGGCVLLLIVLVVLSYDYIAVTFKPNDYDVRIVLDQDEQNIMFNIYEKGTNKPAKLIRKMTHVHILPADLSTLYHVHPHQVETGVYELSLDFIPAHGEYDLWLEIQIDDHHDGAFYQKFTLDLETGSNPLALQPEQRLTAELIEAELYGPNEMSHLHYLLMLDDKPVQEFSTYIDVEVHTFVVSKARDFIAHDHAHLLGDGMVDAHMLVPLGGEYILFLEPTVVTPEGDYKEVISIEFLITDKN